MMKLCPIKYNVAPSGGGASPFAKALLHFDQTDGATTYDDEYGNTWIGSGSFVPAISTARSKFNTGSLQMLWGATTGVCETNIAGLQGDDDLTLDFWHYNDVAGGGLAGQLRTLFEIELNDNIYRVTNENIGGAGVLTLADVGDTSGTTTTGQIADAWTHYRFVRVGDTCYLSMNGVLEATVVGSSAPGVGTYPIRISLGNTFPGAEGNFDEVYFTTEALPTTFTPPVAPWPNP
jgi:hypothetical protein